jgi:F0F1-type ATP synthase assembly protein I
MNKPIYGLLLGGALGILDGLTAWFTPEVRAAILTIVIGSCIKGLVAGVCIGYFAKKVNSLPLGILFGLAVGMFLAFLAAAAPQPNGQHYYFAIMLPGSLVGAIVGYATQQYHPKSATKSAHS